MFDDDDDDDDDDDVGLGSGTFRGSTTARAGQSTLATPVAGASGVTRVGVTPGGKLMVSPYFFLKKLTTFFSHRPLESDDLF